MLRDTRKSRTILQSYRVYRLFQNVFRCTLFLFVVYTMFSPPFYRKCLTLTSLFYRIASIFLITTLVSCKAVFIYVLGFSRLSSYLMSFTYNLQVRCFIYLVTTSTACYCNVIPNYLQRSKLFQFSRYDVFFGIFTARLDSYSEMI